MQIHLMTQKRNQIIYQQKKTLKVTAITSQLDSMPIEDNTCIIMF